jgi:hypothetical protein
LASENIEFQLRGAQAKASARLVEICITSWLSSIRKQNRSDLGPPAKSSIPITRVSRPTLCTLHYATPIPTRGAAPGRLSEFLRNISLLGLPDG